MTFTGSMRKNLPFLAILYTALFWGTFSVGAARPLRVEVGNAGNRYGGNYASADLATVWFDKIYEWVRDTPGYSPPVAARAYAYCGVAIYEALVHGMKEDGQVPEKATHPSLAFYNSLASQLNGLAQLPEPAHQKKYHWPTVANAAMQNVTHHFFPASAAAIDGVADGFFGDFEGQVHAQDFQRSIDFGVELANAIIEWSLGDGYAQIGAANAAFVPPVVDGPWVGVGTGLHPAWGALRPFALASAASCSAKQHPTYSESADSAFYAHALVVYNTTGDGGANLTQDQKDIAHFWSDGPGATGTPPGHWVNIMGIIARDEGLSLGTTAEGYARVGISVADAFITCWHTKYETYLCRPFTFVQNQIDSDWTPLLPTPNFPTYTSGHSTQSGATQVVLTDLLGRVEFTDTTHIDRLNAAVLGNLTNGARTFSSLFEAAKEAVVSRLYGGIHFIFDNEIGFEQGVCVGETILDRVHFKK